MKLNDRRVSHKLWGTMMGLLLALLLVAVCTHIRLRQVSDGMDQQVARYDKTIASARQWQGLVAMAVGLSADSLTTTDEVLRQDFALRTADLTTRTTQLQEAAQKAAAAPNDQAALAAIAAAQTAVRRQIDQINALQELGDAAAIKVLVDTEYRPSGQTYVAAIDQFAAVQIQARDAARQTSALAGERVLWMALASVLLVLVLAVVLTRWLVRCITPPRLAEVVAVLNAEHQPAALGAAALPSTATAKLPAVPYKPAIKYTAKAANLSPTPLLAKPQSAPRRPVAITNKPPPARPVVPNAGDGNGASG